MGVVALMRREYLARTEIKVYEQQLAADGLWKAPAAAKASAGPKPVSLRAKVVASVSCLVAFVGPVYFLLVFAAAQGRKLTRCWYFSTLSFVFIAVFIVEPFTLFLLKVAVPASVYAKLRWMEDPTSVPGHFRFKLFVAHGSVFRASIEGEELELRVEQPEGGRFRFDAEDGSGTADYARSAEGVWVSAGGHTYGYEDRTLAPVEGAAPGSDGRILSHSDGKIVAVHTKPGEQVTAGQTLVVLEAMKMEFQLATPVAGTVDAVEVEAGQQVGARQLLVSLTPEASADG